MIPRKRSSLVWVLAVLAALVSIVVSLIPIVFALKNPAPGFLYAAGMVVDGWRSAHHLPVYENPELGRCTNMYGPLYPWVLGRLYSVFGLSNQIGKYLSLACTMMLMGLGLSLCRRQLRGVGWLFALTLWFSGVNRLQGVYTWNHPDMAAWFCAFIALYVSILSLREKSFLKAAIASCLFLSAFLLKQPTLMLTIIVPLEAVWSRRFEKSGAQRYLIALFPLITGVIALLCLKTFYPSVFFYFFTMPRWYPIRWGVFFGSSAAFLLTIPLFWACLVLAWKKRGNLLREETSRILLLTCAVTFPLAQLTAAKGGGNINSLAPLLIAIILFCSYHLIEVKTWIETRTGASRFFLGCAFAGALFYQSNPELAFETYHFKVTDYRASEYETIVSLARELPGMVRSPEDPTIALHAKGQFGLSFGQEQDCSFWKLPVPKKITEEISEADYLISVETYQIFNPSYLAGLGFSPVRKLTAYSIWQKSKNRE